MEDVDGGTKITITDVNGVNEYYSYTGGSSLNDGDNIIIEDNNINVYTNTGYIVMDDKASLQELPSTSTSAYNQIIHTEDEITITFQNLSNRIRRSYNGLDFEVIKMKFYAKEIIYDSNLKRLIALPTTTGGFYVSNDYGDTWELISSSYTNGAQKLFKHIDYTGGFAVIGNNLKRIITLTEDFRMNSSINTTIACNFITKLNAHQFIWCNTTGTFKYGAGTQEGNFVSLPSGSNVSMLKTVNGLPIAGLNGSDKIYTTKATNMIIGNEWIEHTLPITTTISDVVYNPYEATYFILTTSNIYFKTKDFETFEQYESDKTTGFKFAAFTQVGIQASIIDSADNLLLIPTRTKLEDKAQEWDRALNKERWVGDGL